MRHLFSISMVGILRVINFLFSSGCRKVVWLKINKQINPWTLFDVMTCLAMQYRLIQETQMYGPIFAT